MMRSVLIALAVVASASLAAGQATRPQSPAQPRGDAQKGKAAFLKAGCDTCHGTVGHGGAGARLAPNPIAADVFIAYVRSGRRGWSVAGGMPAYPVRLLSDETLLDIRAYLATIPAPPRAAAVPLLQD